MRRWVEWARAQRIALAGLGAILIALLATQAASPMPAVHGDGYFTYLWARTIVYDGDIDFANDFALCGKADDFKDMPAGRNVNLWNMGPAIFWIPILAVDRVVSRASHDSDPRVAAGCRGQLPERAVRGSVVAGFLAIVFGFLAARRQYALGPSLFAAAGIALMSPLTYYATMMLSYGHAASAFAGALFVYLWLRDRENRSLRSWLALGASLGLAMLMRSQNVILAVLPLIDWCIAAAAVVRIASPERTRRAALHVACGVAFVLCAIAVFFPQLHYCKKVSGHWFTVLQSESYMRWTTPNVLRVLFSSANGLFPFNPILYPATLGLFLLARARETRTLGIGLLVVFALDAYVNSCVWDWWASIGYPGRRFDLLTAPWIVGLARFAEAVVDLARRHRQLALRAVAGGTLLVGGIAAFFVQYALARAARTDLPRESPETWTEMVSYGSSSIWDAVGNPLAWPGSIPLAIRWRVHPRRWDALGGPELFYHEERSLERREDDATIWFGNREHANYLDGFGSNVDKIESRRVRKLGPGRARILMPLHYPDAGALSFTVLVTHADADVTLALEVNGRTIGTQTVDQGGKREIAFTLEPGTTHHGINELFVTVEKGTLGFERMDILDRTPTPADRQKERDAIRRAQRP